MLKFQLFSLMNQLKKAIFAKFWKFGSIFKKLLSLLCPFKELVKEMLISDMQN